MVSDDAVGKPSLVDKKILLGGAIACVVIGGGAYYFYKTRKSQDSDTTTVTSDTSSAAAPDTVVASESNPPDADAQGMKERGNKYFKGGKFEKAIECYTKAIELCEEDSVADQSTFYQNRAAAYEQLKDWDKVVDDCTLAIERNSKYAKALHRRAKAYEALDQKDKCLDDVTAVCLLEQFRNQNALMLLQRVLKGIGKDKAAAHYPKRPKVLPSATSIKNYLDSFNKDIFDVPSEDDSALGEYMYFEILKNMKNNEFDDVLRMCGEVVESGSKHRHRARLLQGTLKTLMNEKENAIADFDAIIDAIDESDVDGMNELKVDALIKRGSLKMQQENDVGCYADLTKAIEIDDQNPNIYHNRGQLYFFTERLEEAKVEFNQAISLDSSYIAPRIQLGQCLFKIAMQSMSPSIMKEANDTLEETTRLFPESSHTYSIYGQLLMSQQRHDEALAKFEKAIALSPTTAETYVHKGGLLFQWKQDLDGAEALIKKAIEMDAKCDIAYETLAMMQVQKQELEEGIKTFERSLELVRTEEEMGNIYALLEAAKAQAKATKELGIQNPAFM